MNVGNASSAVNVSRAMSSNPLALMKRSLVVHSVASDEKYDAEEEEDDDESVFVEDENKNDVVVKRMNFRVNVSRIAVILTLLAAGVATAVFTYTTMVNDETEDFQANCYLFVDNIVSSSVMNILSINQALQSLSEKITAAANSTGQTFPFVTTDLFESLSQQVRRRSGVEMITYTPVVQEAYKLAWEDYSQANQGWLQDSRESALSSDKLLMSSSYIYGNISSYIYESGYVDGVYVNMPSSNGTYLPAWQTSPPPFDPGFVNHNLLSHPSIQKYFGYIQATRSAFVTEALNLTSLGSTAINSEDHLNFHYQFLAPNSPSLKRAIETKGFSQPHSLYMQPVFETVSNPRSRLVAMIFAILPWDRYFQNLLPDGVGGIYSVLSNNCNQSFTYMLNGTSAIYLGEGDLHEVRFDYLKRTLYTQRTSSASNFSVCSNRIDLYPSSQLENKYYSNFPVIMSIVVASAFFAMAVTFFMYDRFVRMRNDKVVAAAVRSDKIVSSLFPSNVRDRILAADQEEEQHEVQIQQGTQSRLRNLMFPSDAPFPRDLEAEDIMYKTKPIADLFPETSVMFADIAGFTAWSSAREPHQVFVLLETVYKAFDEIAKRRRIFKVETVGDCYVAATGLPEPRMDHAVAMCRFAKDCMFKMQSLTRRLELTLGPDTADLAMRMGIHSGPVTAGVLRGERSRFQLFGDTMNTASRMESTGLRDRIQISQDTAKLLVTAGKKQWVVAREDTVNAKGKGEMRTYWLDISRGKGTNTSTSIGATELAGDRSVSSEGMSENNEELEAEAIKPTASAKLARLLDWNVDVLLRLLKSIVAHRQARGIIASDIPPNEEFTRRFGATVLDEVEERICLPEFDPAVAKAQVPPEEVELTPEVESQLYEYTTAIAGMYRDNPFHNFEHASHVTMSVSKLLSRIVAPSDIDFQSREAKNQTLHDHTYGITSDPLTQFACVLSALIHDVDHTGVPNSQLVKENPRMAAYYKGRSIAEQNSVDVAWDLLFDDCYSDLRRTIYTTDEELRRFRMLVVNSVMATDIMDKDLKELRNARWDRAFAENAEDDDPLGTIQRKATIVIEHLIQASDVAHTMQHWHIYRKWNGRLFEEMYKAFIEGRAEKDPSEFWYKGEIGFFDFYIIPLAKKLKNCGVFGVSSDEYLNYAEQNRKEWEARGQEVVSELVQLVKVLYKSRPFGEGADYPSQLITMNASNETVPQ